MVEGALITGSAPIAAGLLLPFPPTAFADLADSDRVADPFPYPAAACDLRGVLLLVRGCGRGPGAFHLSPHVPQ